MNTDEKLPASETKQGFWSRHIAAWKESGLNMREYCEHEDLSIHIRLGRGIELGIVPGTDTKYLGELVNTLENL